PDADVDHLRTKLEPPPSWRIWITRFAGIADGYYSAHTAMQRAALGGPVGIGRCNEQVSTFVVGRLCAHLFSSVSSMEFDRYEGIEQTRIWPASGFDIISDFIPQITLDQVDELHEAVAKAGYPPIRV